MSSALRHNTTLTSMPDNTHDKPVKLTIDVVTWEEALGYEDPAPAKLPDTWDIDLTMWILESPDL